VDEVGERVEARIGHSGGPDVRFDGGKGIGRDRRVRTRQGVEERGFACIRQTDQAEFK
jgi:hypothetical protein